jgi:hypothetical protein
MAFRGATLKELHSSFQYGSGLVAILSSVSAFNTVELAGIFMPILLLDGPLLQRALSVQQILDVSTTNKTLLMSPSPFMLGATGILADHTSVPSLYSPLFAKILQQYTNREPILWSHNVCAGSCELEVVAPGWDIACTQSSEPYHLLTYQEIEQVASHNHQSATTVSNSAKPTKSSYQLPKTTQTMFDVKVNFNYTTIVYEADSVSGVSSQQK